MRNYLLILQKSIAWILITVSLDQNSLEPPLVIQWAVIVLITVTLLLLLIVLIQNIRHRSRTY